jgi:hypothetical protein
MPRISTIAGAIGLAAIVCGTAAPASAGFFDQLFGGLTRHIRPPEVFRELPQMSPIPGDRVAPQGGANWRARGEGGPRTAFCVRTCDGHYFPVQANAQYSAAQMCSAFCPASETKLYSGSGIDHAVGADGQPYSELPNAYAYRKQLVANCTCNGKDVFGVARLAADSDPTLQRGDVVATRHGMMAVTAKNENGVQFSTADDYRGLPERYRQKLTDMKVTRGQQSPPQTDGRAPSDR